MWTRRPDKIRTLDRVTPMERGVVDGGGGGGGQERERERERGREREGERETCTRGDDDV